MKLSTAGQKVIATYLWTDAIVSSRQSQRPAMWRCHWKAVGEVSKRLSSVLRGLQGIELGAEIAQGLADPRQDTIVRYCLGLKKALSLPEVGLGLALPPTAMTADLAGDLKRQAEGLRRIIGGQHGGSPPDIRAIAETADCYERGSVRMDRILRLLRRRRSMLKDDSSLTHQIGGLARALINNAMTADSFSRIPEPVPQDLHVSAQRFFRFMDHPLLQLAFASYFGTEELKTQFDRPAFRDGGPLASQLKKWEWVVKREPVQIVT